MQPDQARRELADIIIAADVDADHTVIQVLDRLDNIRDALAGQPVPVHESREFLEWLRS